MVNADLRGSYSTFVVENSGRTTIPDGAQKIPMPDLTGSTNNERDKSH